MKPILRSIFSILNKLYLVRFFFRIQLFHNSFFLANISIKKGNLIKSYKGKLVKTLIAIRGKGNKIESSNSTIVRSQIIVEGFNNKLILGENVNLRNIKVILRGENCMITIGKNTIFNGGRIVNEGTDNLIQIGENCLFSDQIEIWSSDTHKIFDINKNIINKEKPIFIGNKVWVGCRVIILKGTTIKNGSIIGMGTIVTNDVGEKEVSVGVPNKTLKNEIYWEE